MLTDEERKERARKYEAEYRKREYARINKALATKRYRNDPVIKERIRAAKAIYRQRPDTKEKEADRMRRRWEKMTSEKGDAFFKYRIARREKCAMSDITYEQIEIEKGLFYLKEGYKKLLEWIKCNIPDFDKTKKRAKSIEAHKASAEIINLKARMHYLLNKEEIKKKRREAYHKNHEKELLRAKKYKAKLREKRGQDEPDNQHVEG
jgi:hypothetical protein